MAPCGEEIIMEYIDGAREKEATQARNKSNLTTILTIPHNENNNN